TDFLSQFDQYLRILNCDSEEKKTIKKRMFVLSVILFLLAAKILLLATASLLLKHIPVLPQ
ncbi:MAG: hypothetical protein WCF14_05970, partial [Nitrososphaeraceae archaeon]